MVRKNLPENKKPHLGHAMLVMVFAAQIVAPQALASVRTEAIPTSEKTYIRQADPSLVMLTGDKLAQAQKEWVEKQRAPKPAVAVKYMTLSAYNSVPNQTDGSPYSTAIGSLTRVGVVASNNLPIGTRIRLPDHFGDQEFRVEDRMNTRYQNNVDVWMEDYKEAVKFGRRYAKIEVIEWGKGRGMD